MPETPLDLNIVFIVGVPRTGTTWVLSLMTEHPDSFHVSANALGMYPVTPTLESAIFVRGKGWTKGGNYDKAIEMLSQLPEGKLLVEKTPAHIIEVEVIRRFIKHPKFILCTRDPLDTLRSMMQPSPHWKTNPRNIQTAVNVWVNHYRTAEEIQADHVVSYEDLWKDPYEETKKLYQRFGLSDRFAEQAVNRTRYGRSLPDGPLRYVFNGGTPGRGKGFFSQADIDYINRRFHDAKNNRGG